MKKVEVQRIRYGNHQIVKVNEIVMVTCVNYESEIVYEGAYLATILSFDDPENEIIQQILDDIKGIKASNPKMRINEITIYTEDDFGERHPFFEMDDCENVLFQTREDKIKQACEELDHKKEKLWDEYATKFGLLPISDCGEYYAEDILALNQWYETESKRLIQEWVDAVNRT